MFEALNKLSDLIQKMIDLNWKIHKSETDTRIYECIDSYVKEIDANFAGIGSSLDDMKEKINELELEIKALKDNK